MPDLAQRERLFVSTTPGLEGVLAQEAGALGAVTPVEGGIELEGTAGLHRRANLWLRTASRVLLRLATIPADVPSKLVAALRALPLAPFRTPAGFALVSVEVASGPIPRRELLRTAEDALGLRLARESLAEAGEVFAPTPVGLWIRAEGTSVTVSVDTSGALLFRRGYRQEVSRAPLRETLAAGILALAEHRPDEGLLDPMCGSGTFLVEGVWRAMRRAPGLSRPFGFEAFAAHDAQTWEAEKAEARAGEVAPSIVHGSDLNAGALGTARRNARRAGVLESLVLERRDVAALAPPQGPVGLVVANPPYGKRVGEGGELVTLYRALGESLRTRFGGWRAAVLVPDATLGRALGFPSPVRHVLDNGGLRVTLHVQQL